MKRRVILLLLLVILVSGCYSSAREDACKDTCESRGYTYHEYLYGCEKADVCLCKTVEGEIVNVW